MQGNDTIAAISTPLGEGGIGIVKISGKDAYRIADKIFNPSGNHAGNYPRPCKLYHGFIRALDGGGIIDEVLVSFMPEPHTYTRENIVEINCHSGVFALRSILDQVLKAGARLAEPGEFTKRAFLSGRIDLSQAEAVMNIIRARSDQAVKSAARVMHGELAKAIEDIKDEIISIRAPIEAMLDYPDEFDQTEEPSRVKILEQVSKLSIKLTRMLKGLDTNRAFQEGISVAIIGRPNVGKSSLLNALLQQQKAIVHETPGTTRDLLEGYLNLGGYPLRLIDTAGIQGTADPVEKVGIERTKIVAAEARLLIVVLDGSKNINKEDQKILSLCNEEQGMIVVINKDDLERVVDKQIVQNIAREIKVVETSAINETGMEELEQAVAAELDKLVGETVDNSLLVTQRQEIILKDTLKYLDEARVSVLEQPWDIVSSDLNCVWLKIGEITGSTFGEDLLDRVFSQFCLGK